MIGMGERGRYVRVRGSGCVGLHGVYISFVMCVCVFKENSCTYFLF